MAQPLVVEQSRAIPIAPDEAMTRMLPMPLPVLFDRWYGPIPPIKAIRDQTGEWTAAGQTRTIVLAGGGTMHETLTSVDAPHSFGYLIDGLTGPLAALVDHVDGTWSFTPHGTGTRVTWQWVIHGKSALTAPVLPVFGRIWMGYARQALGTLSDYLVG